MYITRITIENYKSYFRPTSLDLKPGFNVVTGENNRGKTALLEALQLLINDIPHDSILSRSTVTVAPNPHSIVTAGLAVPGLELKDLLLIPGSVFRLPIPDSSTTATERFVSPKLNDGTMGDLLNWLFSQPELILHAKSTRGTWVPAGGLCFGIYETQPPGGLSPYIAARFDILPDRTWTVSELNASVNHHEDEDPRVRAVRMLRDRIYYFEAQRQSTARCQVGPQTNLLPNAANLPEVLSNLQGNRFRWEEYLRTINEVLPQVKQVGVINVPGSSLEVRVWTDDAALGRQDLSFSLAQCGTGISQVLAILYVVMTAPYPRVIIIDEPQSFLHPGAIRKLLAVLKRYPQHQYVLATHSPTVIKETDPAKINMIRQDGPVSTFTPIDPKANDQLRLYLEEIGARLSDVFGADNVLWVEGATEQECFPIILQKVAKQSLGGTVIVGVKHTGDLQGRHAQSVFEIYERLTSGTALVPPALGFIFDREGRSDRERQDMDRRSGGQVRFLGRRLYENYLLNPAAIAVVMNEIEGFRNPPVTAEEIAAEIEICRKDDGYYRHLRNGRQAPEKWSEDIHGAQVLSHLFQAFGKRDFQKTEHSVALTKWLAEHSPEDLEEIATLLVELKC